MSARPPPGWGSPAWRSAGCCTATPRISPNLAVRLEEAGVGTARTWLAMQTAHDLAAERATGSHNVRPLNDVA